MGGGVVDGLFDSTDMEPLVRFGVRFGGSPTTLLINFFSSSLGVCGRDLVLVCGVAILSAKYDKRIRRKKKIIISKLMNAFHCEHNIAASCGRPKRHSSNVTVNDIVVSKHKHRVFNVKIDKRNKQKKIERADDMTHLSISNSVLFVCLCEAEKLHTHTDTQIDTIVLR